MPLSLLNDNSIHAGYYRIRKIDADQTHVSDHKSLGSLRKKLNSLRAANVDVRVVWVNGDGSWSEVSMASEMEETE